MSERTEPDASDVTIAGRHWCHFPFRRCWVAYPPNDGPAEVILKPTAHLASSLARRGWTVFELKPSSKESKREQANTHGS